MMSPEREVPIFADGRKVFRAIACLASPLEGLRQQGLIKMVGGGGSKQGKHILYMLTQRALLDFEEKVLEVQQLRHGAILVIPLESGEITLSEGAALAMDKENRVQLFIHKGLKIRPMLVAFHRMATRMIRLDIP